MIKRWILVSVALMGFILPAAAFAADKPNVDIQIISPAHVKEYPGAEMQITARVTNQSAQAIDDMMVYITMADIVKHWTVNLEDYSADKPVTIGTLQPHETKEVLLPIRFVYTSSYFLYVTAVGTKGQWIYSSSSIPIEILGNTKINPASVQVVSIVEPLVLLGMVVFLSLRKRKRSAA